MSIVPSLDLHPNSPDFDEVPSSIESEQDLLGLLLFDNAALDHLPDGFNRNHFREPLHGRLFSSILATVRAGFTADPYSVMEEFRGDGAFHDLGGVEYLGDLIDRAPPMSAVATRAKTLMDVALRRELIKVAALIRSTAIDPPREEDTDLPWTAEKILGEAERLMLAAQMGTRQPQTTTIQEAFTGVIEYIESPSDNIGVHCGITPLDAQIGPLMPGDCVVLGGRPSMGKSAVALAIALNIGAPDLADRINGRDPEGRAACGVLEIHGEMSWGGKGEGGQTARRHMADIGYGLYGSDFPTYKQIRDRKVSHDQLEMMRAVAREIDRAPITGVKRTGITVSQLRSIARRTISDWKRRGILPGLIVVDHVGLMRGEGRHSSRYSEQTQIAIDLKQLADELGIPILALVQLSRDVEKREDKRPMQSDLRDTGAWEEIADIIMFVYRDAYYAVKEPEPPQSKTDDWVDWDARCKSKAIELIIDKLREGERGTTAKVWGALGWNAIRGHEPDRIGGINNSLFS